MLLPFVFIAYQQLLPPIPQPLPHSLCPFRCPQPFLKRNIVVGLSSATCSLSLLPLVERAMRQFVSCSLKQPRPTDKIYALKLILY